MQQVRRIINDQEVCTNIIYRLDTKGKILSFEDACPIIHLNEEDARKKDKVIFNCTEYGEDKPSVNLKHYVDLADMLLIVHDLLIKQPVKFTDYKGTKNPNYETGYESRILNISYVENLFKDAGGFAINIKTGPGIGGDKGQVMPAKEGGPTKEIKMCVPTPAMRTAAAVIQNYYQAKAAAAMAVYWKQLFVNKDATSY